MRSAAYPTARQAPYEPPPDYDDDSIDVPLNVGVCATGAAQQYVRRNANNGSSGAASCRASAESSSSSSSSSSSTSAADMLRSRQYPEVPGISTEPAAAALRRFTRSNQSVHFHEPPVTHTHSHSAGNGHHSSQQPPRPETYSQGSRKSSTSGSSGFSLLNWTFRNRGDNGGVGGNNGGHQRPPLPRPEMHHQKPPEARPASARPPPAASILQPSTFYTPRDAIYVPLAPGVLGPPRQLAAGRMATTPGLTHPAQPYRPQTHHSVDSGRQQQHQQLMQNPHRWSKTASRQSVDATSDYASHGEASPPRTARVSPEQKSSPTASTEDDRAHRRRHDGDVDEEDSSDSSGFHDDAAKAKLRRSRGGPSSTTVSVSAPAPLAQDRALRLSCPELDRGAMMIASGATVAAVGGGAVGPRRHRRAKEKARRAVATWQNKNLKEWTLDDVLLWLQHCRLDDVASVLVGYDLRGDDVAKWDHDTLARLGVSSQVQRQRVLDELAAQVKREREDVHNENVDIASRKGSDVDDSQNRVPPPIKPRRNLPSSQSNHSSTTEKPASINLFDLVRRSSADQVLAVETALTVRDITVTQGRNQGRCLQVTRVNGANIPLQENDCLLEINDRAGHLFRSPLQLTQLISEANGAPLRFVVLRRAVGTMSTPAVSAPTSAVGGNGNNNNNNIDGGGGAELASTDSSGVSSSSVVNQNSSKKFNISQLKLKPKNTNSVHL